MFHPCYEMPGFKLHKWMKRGVKCSRVCVQGVRQVHEGAAAEKGRRLSRFPLIWTQQHTPKVCRLTWSVSLRVSDLMDILHVLLPNLEKGEVDFFYL